MIELKYDPRLPYMVVPYGRMSGNKQNPRSPDQQFDHVREVYQRCGFPWNIIATYRDDAISGRYVLRRPGLQKMLRDIELGIIAPDLIALDTYERIGRAEEIDLLRQTLKKKFGILVVTADSNFANPTGAAGKAMGMVDQIRATEENRIKGQMVMRGKRDAARLKRWPGGPVPFGYMLRPMTEDLNG